MVEQCGQCRYRNNSVVRLLEHTAERHLSCHTCDLQFDDQNLLDRHFDRDPTHNYHFCRLCRLHFPPNDSIIDHIKETHEIHCQQCHYRPFYSTSGLLKHRLKSAFHNWCQDCSRDFSSQSNLDQHLRSNIHQNSDVKCPRKGCGKKFVSMGAFFLHAERGCMKRRLGEVIKAAVFHCDDGEVILFETKEKWMYSCPSKSCSRTGPRYKELSGLWQHLECRDCSAWEDHAYGEELVRIEEDVMSRLKSVA